MAESFQIGHGLIQTNDFGPLISGDRGKSNEIYKARTF